MKPAEALRIHAVHLTLCLLDAPANSNAWTARFLRGFGSLAPAALAGFSDVKTCDWQRIGGFKSKTSLLRTELIDRLPWANTHGST